MTAWHQGLENIVRSFKVFIANRKGLPSLAKQ